jgi:putative ABC transport system permease protein
MAMGDGWSADLRFSLRTLRRRPAFTVPAVLTLALGVGIASATFSVVDTVLIRNLPYPESAQLVTVWMTFPEWQKIALFRESWNRVGFDYPEYVEWRDTQSSFGETALLRGSVVSLVGRDEPVQITVEQATADFFPLLRIRPFLGRLFEAADDQPGAPRVAVLSYATWQSYFGASPNVVGSRLKLDLTDGIREFTVIGVLPAEFQYRMQRRTPAADVRRVPHVWIPLLPEGIPPSDSHTLEVIARLKPAVDIEGARSETAALAPRLTSGTKHIHGGDVVHLQNDERARVRTALLVLMAAAALVMLIACGNVSNLLLAEAIGRQHEMAIRTTLGAARARIIRQLLTESAVLAIAGGVAGTALAFWAVRGLVAVAPPDLPRIHEVRVDLRVLATMLAVSTVSGIFFGLVPALNLMRADPNRSLRQAHSDARQSRLQGAIISFEIAVTFVMLLVASLLSQSLLRLSAVDPGFRTGNLITLQLRLSPVSRYQDAAARASFYQQALNRLSALPGVIGVTAGSILPYSANYSTTVIEVEGRPSVPIAERPSVHRRMVLPNYFQIMGIPIVEGRVFSETEADSGAEGIVISRSLATALWRSESALAKRLRVDGASRPVIGVVNDVLDHGLSLAPESTFYRPNSRKAPGNILIRTAGDPALTIPFVRQTVKSIDPDLAAGRITTMDEMIFESMASERYRTMLIGLFSVAACLLAVVGLYGVVARSVAHQWYEFGVRIAVGAQPVQMTMMVLKRSLKLAAIGIALGFVGTVAVTNLISSFLFGITTTDIPTYMGVTTLLVAVAIMASFCPARRASHADPATTLRSN